MRLLWIVVLGLTCWANSGNQAIAQNSDNLVRVTYPVAELVVPIENHSLFQPVKNKTTEEMLQELLKQITAKVAPDSWEARGGAGKIQYFPMSMAIVVNQRQDVQDAIAKLLVELRKPQDTQIALELRLLMMSAALSERMHADLPKHGQSVRALEIRKTGPIGRFASLDDKQVFALLTSVQADRSAHIMQAPKITMYNGQQAAVGGFMERPEGKRGLGCDVHPVLETDQKNVRVALDLACADPEIKVALRAAGTFVIPNERTLIWHLGESGGQHVWALLTPRVIVTEPETSVVKREVVPAAPTTSSLPQSFQTYPSLDFGFKPTPVQPAKAAVIEIVVGASRSFGMASKGQLKRVENPNSNIVRVEKADSTHEVTLVGVSVGRTQITFTDQDHRVEEYEVVVAAPAPQTSESSLKDPKEKAIELRLRQPISLHMKNRPLRDAVRDMSAISGIQVVLDMGALETERINLDTPLDIHVEDIDMRFALNIMLKPLCLTYTIENQVLLITTDVAKRRLVRIAYPVHGILIPMDLIDKTPHEQAAERLMVLIRSAIAKNSWDDMGDEGRIQYFPQQRELVVNQTQEIQEEVQQLLASLRRGYSVGVAVDVRLVQASKTLAQRWSNAIGDRADFTTIDPPSCGAMLLEAERDRGTRIAPLPQFPVLSGQTIEPEVMRKVRVVTDSNTQVVMGESVRECEWTEGGWRCELKPVVSPDRRMVRTALTVEHFTDDEGRTRSLMASREFAIADGDTLLWRLGENAGQHLFVLVTTRVQVRQQEDRLLLGDLEAIRGR